MSVEYVIEDEAHAEQFGTFATLDEAVAELRRLATLPWDQEPNVAPCTSWRTCGREYKVVEYDNAFEPSKVTRRIPVLSINARGVEWHDGASV